MKYILLLILLAVTLSFVHGQQSNSVKLISFNQTSCDQSTDPYRIQDRIISRNLHGDTLRLEIGFAATCCLTYTPVAAINHDTLNIHYAALGDQQSCSGACCYTFNLTIQGIRNDGIPIKFGNRHIALSTEKYKTYPISFEMLHSDTVNLTDKYGFKQGLWISGDSKRYHRYQNNKPSMYGHLYEATGNPRDEYNFNAHTYTEYYPSGQKSKTCDQSPPDWRLINCIEWNLDGTKK